MPRFFIRRFGRPRFTVPDSPEIWMVGDLAECIKGDNWINVASAEAMAGPSNGEVRIVVGVDRKRVEGAAAPVQFLQFERYPGRRFCACSFRKIIPRADACERGDPAFAELIRIFATPRQEEV